MNKIKFYIKKIPLLYSFLYNIYCFLIIIIDFLIIYTIPNKINREGVLLVKPDHIGDFIIWLDAAKEFRNLYKGQKITVLCDEKCEEIASKLYYFDNVISFNKNKFNTDFFLRIKILTNIRKTSYKTVIQVSAGRAFSVSESIIRVSGAEQIIGFDKYISQAFSNTLKWKKKISDKYYTTLVKEKANITGLECNAEIIKNLGLKNFKCSLQRLPENVLPKFCLEIETEKYYVLFPGASSPGRIWEIEKFAEIAQKIHEYKGWTGIVCGGKNDEILGKMLIKNAPTIPLINMTGKTSVLELASIIKNAAIIITNETSAVHIAAAVSISSVCILGGGHYGKVLPIPQHIQGDFKPNCVIYKMDCFNCDWQCIYKLEMDEPFPCIKNVSTNAVWEETVTIINPQ